MTGHNQAEAYRIAFRPARRRTCQDIATASCRIAANPLIKAKIAELSGKAETKTIMSFNQRLQILGGIMQSSTVKLTDKIRAIEVYNKMAGDNSPERMELSGPEGSPLQLSGQVGIQHLTVQDKIKLMKEARDKARAAQ